jgi:hypothetical protein
MSNNLIPLPKSETAANLDIIFGLTKTFVRFFVNSDGFFCYTLLLITNYELQIGRAPQTSAANS